MAMEALAALPYENAFERDPRLRVLVADDDPLARSLLASSASGCLDDIVVLEAEDGAQAVQLGLQRQPQIAVLDINMPRLGGIEAAITLRGLQPRIRLALRTADPVIHGERARANHLLLLSKLELERTLEWLRTQVRWYTETRPAEHPSKGSFACSACGYGVVRASPPERCPMCQTEHAWIQTRLTRPFAAL
jgi:CheY-like chemotaxis protein